MATKKGSTCKEHELNELPTGPNSGEWPRGDKLHSFGDFLSSIPFALNAKMNDLLVY